MRLIVIDSYLSLDATSASKIEANASHQGSMECTLGPTPGLFCAASVIAWLVFVSRPCMLRTGCRPTGREGFLRFSSFFLLFFLFRNFLPFLCHALHLLGQNGLIFLQASPLENDMGCGYNLLGVFSTENELQTRSFECVDIPLKGIPAETVNMSQATSVYYSFAGSTAFLFQKIKQFASRRSVKVAPQR